MSLPVLSQTNRLLSQSAPATDARAEETLRRVRSGLDIRTISASETLELFWPWTYIDVDTTAGSVSLTLPAVERSRGYVLYVSKLVAANTVTLVGSINGAGSLAWTTRYQSFTIVGNGTDYRIV